jgi:hypothetical protein
MAGHRPRNVRRRPARGRVHREAEVRDARLAPAVDHHVGRLEVAVQHPLVVRPRQPRAQLPRDPPAPWPAVAGDDSVSVGARDEADAARMALIIARQILGSWAVCLSVSLLLPDAWSRSRENTHTPRQPPISPGSR